MTPRLTALLFAGLIVAGLVARTAFATRPWLEHRAHVLAYNGRMGALVDLGATEMKRFGTAPAANLAEACRGRLPTVAPQALLAFFGPLPEALERFRIDARLPSDELYGFGEATAQPALSLHGRDLTNFERTESLPDFFMSRSQEWDQMIDRFKALEPQADAARYLLVNRIVDVTLPALGEAGTFRPGVAVIHVRVLDAASGDLSCEGLVTTRSASTITSHGSGPTQELAAGMAEAIQLGAPMQAFGQALSVASLDALCGSGGEQLCESTRAVIENVEVFR